MGMSLPFDKIDNHAPEQHAGSVSSLNLIDLLRERQQGARPDSSPSNEGPRTQQRPSESGRDNSPLPSVKDRPQTGAPESGRDNSPLPSAKHRPQTGVPESGRDSSALPPAKHRPQTGVPESGRDSSALPPVKDRPQTSIPESGRDSSALPPVKDRPQTSSPESGRDRSTPPSDKNGPRNDLNDKVKEKPISREALLKMVSEQQLKELADSLAKGEGGKAMQKLAIEIFKQGGNRAVDGLIEELNKQLAAQGSKYSLEHNTSSIYNVCSGYGAERGFYSRNEIAIKEKGSNVSSAYQIQPSEYLGFDGSGTQLRPERFQKPHQLIPPFDITDRNR